MSVVHSPKDNRINDTESSESSIIQDSLRIPTPPPFPPPSVVDNTRSRRVLFQGSNSTVKTTATIMPGNIDSLKTKRRTFKSKLTKTSNWLKGEEVKDALPETIDLKLTDLMTKFADWDADQINLLVLDPEHEEDHEREADIISNSYFNIAGELKRILNQRVGPSTTQLSPTNRQNSSSNCQDGGTSAKLPEVTLPTFDGSFENFRRFHDEYQAVIHQNKKLHNVTKFQYLKSCLHGEAADLISELETTGENYEIAWKLLQDTYNNPRLILRRHCSLLMNLFKKKDSPSTLIDIVNSVRAQLRPLDTLGTKEEQYNAFLVTIVLNLISDDVAFQWENSLEDNKMPDVEKLLDFLQKIGLSKKSTEAGKLLQKKEDIKKSDTRNKDKCKQHTASTSARNPTATTHNFHLNVQRKCPVCQAEHSIYKCPKFQEMNQEKRLKLVYNQNRCINCLALGHGVQSCQSRNCAICDDVLPTAVIHILNRSQKIVPCRILLDTGSSTSFITTRFADQLQLEKTQCSITVGALNDLLTVANYYVTATIRSRYNNFEKTINFLAIPAISSSIPAQQLDRKLLQLPNSIRLQLADPEFHKPSPVQLLLASGHTISTLAVGQHKIDNAANLIAQNTLFGWTICGSVHNTAYENPQCHVTTNIIDELKKFWEIEDGISSQKHLSPVAEACERHFIENVSRTPDGRYMVALPFNELKDQLGSSRAQALRRFLALERRHSSNHNLWSEYSAVIEEYKQLGHMKKVEDEIEEGFYLAHHAVIKMSSMTTKVRVVFDGSAKSSNGSSLNDALMIGPTIQDDVFALLLCFRIPKFVLTGDIEKMYRQILVRPEDRKFQRIFWRDKSTDKQPNVYELQTVTFGLAPAPYLATRCLHQLADDENHNFPLASKILKEDLFVDDALTGADSLEEIIDLRDDMISLLRKGGFNLRQCASNSPAVLQGLPDCAVNIKLLGGDESLLKTLGIHWDSQQDVIVYTVNSIATKDVITMRTIASDVARIFDPLGLLNPVIAHAKIIQQELWRLKLDWDDSVPQETCTKWQDFSSQLPLLNDLSFQRRVICLDAEQIELHGFSDASERAYGACIYLVTVNDDGSRSVQLWCAKSRITPLKSSQTIPRLELCASELLTDLYVSLKKATNINPDKEYFWTDSMIVLQWIHKSPHTLQTFVANRVAKIQQRTEPLHWRHVRTHDNPADAISRGQLPVEFKQNLLWRHGPRWLTGGEDTWPHTPIEVAAEVPDVKKAVCLTSSTRPRASQTSSKVSISENLLFSRFSCYQKLRRFVALALRWTVVCKKPSAVDLQQHDQIDLSHKFLTIYELDAATTRILLVTQRAMFSEEFRLLEAGEFVSKTSKLHHLNPFIDDKGLIRVGGRVEKAKAISFDERHPIVLPPFHHITRLLITEIHQDNFHTGCQSTLHLLRRRFWPIDGRRQIRVIINNCVTCVRFKPPPVNYLMGDLPTERVIQSKPFEHTGVDYCGPLFIKEKKHRNRSKVKVWISIFVCFTTKAVHIEVVDDLSTEEFLAAFSRFISRHPGCNSMHSDNGTNFVGANNELQELLSLVENQGHQEKIQHHLAQQGIQWYFIPPHAPHCGGLWEAAVKSFKHHLRRVIRHELLTHQQLNTLCIKIEGILNSRPLTPLSSDPNDLGVLTPAHFLHGSSTRDLPAPDFLHTPSNRLSYWEHLEKLKQEFWTRWHKEYLSELQIRSKWTDGSHTIKEGSLVLLREDNLPPLQWRMGRIVEVCPGDDNIIRKVKVKTCTGRGDLQRNTVIERNVKKLCLLPTE